MIKSRTCSICNATKLYKKKTKTKQTKIYANAAKIGRCEQLSTQLVHRNIWLMQIAFLCSTDLE